MDKSSLYINDSENESNGDNLVDDNANPSKNPFEPVTTLSSTSESTPYDVTSHPSEPTQNEVGVNPNEGSSIAVPLIERTSDVGNPSTSSNNESSNTSQANGSTNPFQALIERNNNHNDDNNNNNNNNNKTPNKAIDEGSPPPYPTDSNVTPSHSRDHTTITFASPPEYTAEYTLPVTTQPQATSHPSPSHHRSLSDISGTRHSHSLNDVLLSSDQQSKVCKICQESEQLPLPAQDEESAPECCSSEAYHKGKLISPCKCKGSLQYVHVGCLDQWRNSNVREEASYRCEVCKYEYKFYRPRMARIFSSYFMLHSLTMLLLLIMIYLVSYIVKLFDMDLIHKTPNHEPQIPPNPNKPPSNEDRWEDTPFLNLHVIHLIIGISIISAWGLLFFVCMVCFNGMGYTRQNYCYCGGCRGYICCFGYGGCGTTECGGMSGDCGLFVVIIAIFVLVAMFILGLSGAIIAAYLFVQKITSTYLEKVHDRILDVNKD